MYAKDTLFADWLSWFAGERATKPFSLPDGRRTATDGRMIVAVNDGGQTFPVPDGLEKAPGRSVTFLAEPAIGGTVSVSPKHLLEVVGACEHPAAVPCAECNGTKRMRHSCDCEYCDRDYHDGCDWCDSTGKTESIPDARPMTIYGRPFDANRIAYILEHTPEAEAVQVYLSGDSVKLHIVAPQWHAVLGGMTEDVITNARREGRKLVEVMEELSHVRNH